MGPLLGPVLDPHFGRIPIHHVSAPMVHNTSLRVRSGGRVPTRPMTFQGPILDPQKVHGLGTLRSMIWGCAQYVGLCTAMALYTSNMW
jgi:hypothetical protein